MASNFTHCAGGGERVDGAFSPYREEKRLFASVVIDGNTFAGRHLKAGGRNFGCSTHCVPLNALPVWRKALNILGKTVVKKPGAVWQFMPNAR